MRPDASVLVTLGIPAIAAVVVVLVGAGVARAAPDALRRYALGAAAWLAYTTALAASGVLARFDAGPPPPFLLLLVPGIALPVLIARSSLGARLARLPIAWLVGFHAFRLPLELVMHQAAAEGTMPSQMTYTGLNFDIVTGGTAVVVALLASRDLAPRWLILAWNALGTALLLAIMTIAVASLPAIGAFDQPNLFVAYAPFHTLPAVLVVAALLGHLVVWKRLVIDSAPVATTGARRTTTTRREESECALGAEP